MDYYNDNDPGAVAWLNGLVAAGLIPAGEIDSRDIRDVKDVSGRRAHFFAGIGGWAKALDLAGFPAGPEVWTGSCPCQPFSISGKKKGVADARHLWPEWKRLIEKHRPSIVFGEQVASPDGRKWLAGVQADLEALDYRFGAADLCAAGVGAPHPRQRLYWVADTECLRTGTGEPGIEGSAGLRWNRPPVDGSPTDGLGNAAAVGRVEECAIACRRASGGGQEERKQRPWDDFDVVSFRDGKSRRAEPGTFPLAHGVPGRVVKLRGYGNAIVPALAAKFIVAYLEARGIMKDVPTVR